MTKQAKRQIVAFDAWEPDNPLYQGKQVPEARNVFPTKNGYRSMPSLVNFSYPSLPGGVALLAHTVRDVNGDLYTLAASSNGNVYSLEGSEWVEKLSGATVSTNRAFAEYGNSMYMVYGSTLYKSSLSGAYSNFEAVEDAPTGQCVAVIKDFLCMGDLTTEGRNRIHWSAMDDPDSWPAPGSDDAAAVQSDYQAFPEGGRVQAVLGACGAADGIIFLERMIQRAAYIGSPYIFNFKCIDYSHGLFAPKSPVSFGAGCVYLSDDGWYITDGTTTRPIGLERIDRWFYDNFDTKRANEVIGIHDPVNRACIWKFPTVNSPANHCDRLLVYSYDINKWSYGIIETQTLFYDFVRGTTLEDLNTYNSLETIPYATLDSTQFQTGRIVVAAFDSAGKMSSMSGTPLEAVIETGEMGGDRMLVHGIRPLVDRGDARALPIYRTRQQEFPVNGVATVQSRDGVCYQHISTVYLRSRVVVPPGGSTWRDATGCEVLYELEGGM